MSKYFSLFKRIFSVNVTNAKAENVSTDIRPNPEEKDLVFSDKSLRILELCMIEPLTKKEMLLKVGVTNQTTNVRSIINPLIASGCLTPVEEDRTKHRNVRFVLTSRGQEYLRIRHPAQTTGDNPEPSLFPELD